MNPFSKIEVRLNYTTGHVIQWWIDPFFTGKAPFTFTLYAFQDNTFQEPIWKKEVGETFFAIDDTNLKQSSVDSYIYKIKLTTADKQEYMSNQIDCHISSDTDVNKYLIASEICRKEWLRFLRVGMYCYILKRKSYNLIANGEVDEITGEPIVNSGPADASWFFKPALSKYSLENKQQSLSYHPDGLGTTYKEAIKVRYPGFPFADGNDILVTREGKRYLVIEQDETYYPGTTTTILQNLGLGLLPPTDSIYKIEVPDFPNE